MLERIIIGVIIGLVAGFVLTRNDENGGNTSNVVLGFVALVVVAFIGSSLMFGAIFGAMAVGEIALGYWLSSAVFSKQKTNRVDDSQARRIAEPEELRKTHVDSINKVWVHDSQARRAAEAKELLKILNGPTQWEKDNVDYPDTPRQDREYLKNL